MSLSNIGKSFFISENLFIGKIRTLLFQVFQIILHHQILQLAVLNPKLAILDETDSGLDVDGLRIVGEGISNLRTPDRAYLVVTHYQRLLEYVKPDYVHVFVDGNIVETGGVELSEKLEKEGYESYQ